jgi:hypothetical protein
MPWICLEYVFSRISKIWIRIGSDTRIRHVWNTYVRGKPWEGETREGEEAARPCGGMRTEELGAVEAAPQGRQEACRRAVGRRGTS